MKMPSVKMPDDNPVRCHGCTACCRGEPQVVLMPPDDVEYYSGNFDLAAAHPQWIEDFKGTAKARRCLISKSGPRFYHLRVPLSFGHMVSRHL
jgi:hypothetical protein